MNPISIVGMVMSLLGMGSSLTNQAVNIHRELNPPQQQAQVQQQCLPPRFKLEVVVMQNGQRQLVCIEEGGTK
ncbi:MAG: hypothetical protein JO071_13945 [Deltaproteobacteria bacterium]|nr:hypothetical protein [Deltaproteobacteria bacterium]